ncbi:MAG TPA: SMP-30/gluconolactonase/LRE family protein [Candidatus Dormibacteraeota bacterium]|jgi:gluconolactonase|nr:SMP-30/gluconolactonase/LRE family protein [Candidatus Dormibacteraeota bacterium]
MPVTVRSPQVEQLIDPSVELETLGSGFIFTEGPIWHPVGRYLLFSDMPGDVRRRWSEAEGVSEARRPSNKCNGMTYDAEGNLIVCEHATSLVVRERPDGRREVIASHFGGKELNSPNDVVVGADGAIYFTDPYYGRMDGFGVPRGRQLGFQGVFRIPPGGSEEPSLVVAEDEFDMPNGLCFSPDGTHLYVNDTPRRHIKIFEIAGDGSLTNGRLFADRIGEQDSTGGSPDGMKCDGHGNIWVTGPDGIWIFDPEGHHLGVVQVPEVIGNLNWGGDGWRHMYIAASTSLYRVPTRVAGNRSSYMDLA